MRRAAHPYPRARQDLVPEKSFQHQVLELARLLGYLAYHTHDSRRSDAGFPDLVLLKPGSSPTCPGRLAFAELKSEAGRLSPSQQLWLEGLQTVPGVEAHLWRPADLPGIARILSRQGDNR